MAANNYFGFTHGGTQYGTAAPGAAYGGQTGYAVAPAAAATYGTQRAAATGYDTAYQAAATQGTYAAHAHAHAAAQHAAAQSAYDASKTAYYQQAAAAAAYPHGAPAHAAPPYEAPKAPYAAAAYAGGARPAQGAAPKGGQYAAGAYGAAAAVAYPAAGAYAASQAQAPAQALPAAQAAAKPLYGAATMYVAHQQAKGNNVAWQGYKKGPGGFGQNKTKPAPKVQQLHYCDVCRISCAGPQTYREHLEGQKHRKKEASAKLAAAAEKAASGGGGRGGASLRCELCDVTCTGADAYAAHVRGIKHQKVVNLHTRLGKPIPSQEPKVVGGSAGAKRAVGAAKIAFVASGGLSTVAGTNAKAGAEAAADADDAADAADEVEEPDVQPVGQDYIEEIKADDGKVLSFNCKLCDCRFNDPNAKEMHMKGRRHRLQYKKKVQPDLVVDVKPSLRQRKLAEAKAQRMLVREELWARRRMHECEMEEEERLYWEERRLGADEWWRRGLGPFGAHARSPHSPARPLALAPAYPPHLQSSGYASAGGRRPESADDRHVAAKHAAVYPEERELQAIQRAVSHAERALKAVSDALAAPPSAPPLPPAAVKAKPVAKGPPIAVQPNKTVKTDSAEAKTNGEKKIKEELKEGESADAKEDGRDNQLFSFQGEGEAAAAAGGGRALRGVMRVGPLAKGLLLRGDRRVRLVVLCADRPTIPLLKRVAHELPKHLQDLQTDDVKYKVELLPAEGAVSVTDGNVNVLVSLTSPVMRETSETVVGAGGTREDRDVLPRQKCLDALAALRHAKWFQARAAGLMSCVMVIRIMRDLCRRVPNWTPLNPWAMELMVEKIISSKGIPLSPGDAFRRVIEAVAGGLLLHKGPGLLDPCEKDTHDALGDLPPQKREDLTASAQQFLRQIAFRQIHKILDMEPLPSQPNTRSPSGWKFPRKRRRSNTEAEGEGKMVKTESDKMDTSEGAAGEDAPLEK